MSDMTTKMISTVQKIRSDHRWRTQLKECEKNIALPIKELSRTQVQEIKEYYSRYGFKKINTDWHQYIYSVSDSFSPEFLPENFFSQCFRKHI